MIKEKLELPGLNKAVYVGKYKTDNSKCGCGFITPTYTGRNPRNCPGCGHDNTTDKEHDIPLAQEILNIFKKDERSIEPDSKLLLEIEDLIKKMKGVKLRVLGNDMFIQRGDAEVSLRII